MEKRELTCIGCPLGCSITVTLENGEIKDVAGYTCKRGHDYARKEVTNPTRIVTSTVRLTGSATGAAVVSCQDGARTSRRARSSRSSRRSVRSRRTRP